MLDYYLKDNDYLFNNPNNIIIYLQSFSCLTAHIYGGPHYMMLEGVTYLVEYWAIG